MAYAADGSPLDTGVSPTVVSLGRPLCVRNAGTPASARYLPALAWLLERLRVNEATRTRILAVASAGYVLVAVATLAYSLSRM